MWFREGTFYQIYPLGFCGAERENDFGIVRHRLGKIEKEVGRLKALGVKAVLFNPLFESERHGYDTVDMYSVDRRLGTDGEFKALVNKLHENGIKVVLDGVFHHVGRAFGPFLEVLEKRESAPTRDWFFVDFHGENRYGDHLSYADWEGHAELVKLNLENPEVQNYLLNAVRFWREEWGIDGLRLDVCYLLPPWFLELLRRTVGQDFFLLGEVIHGTNYAQNICPERLNSITNYECYKGMISAFNSKNLFEIEHSLTRLFSSLPWALYTGKPLLNFVDNHDVLRAATALQNRENLPVLYALLFTMPGIPCLYYGSEYGVEGDKSDFDRALRPCIDDIVRGNEELYNVISALSRFRGSSRALAYGDYEKVALRNESMAFARTFEGETVLAAFNIGEKDAVFALGDERCRNVFTGEETPLSALTLAPHTFFVGTLIA